MKIYLVGGAVRDELLGLPIKERDWVVVGATIDDMLREGYRQVGKEFPVFLHPKTGEEYALARMERKVKPGYQGFSFDTSPRVTLTEDLMRRDLTINAMAKDLDNALIDPYSGRTDLENKVLRHVSAAFAEDPVRILRIGRFLARYYHMGFYIADETLMLMSQMVKSGEVNALVAERVWKELERALSEKNPEQFFLVLSECHALPILFPHLKKDGGGMAALVAAAKLSEDPAVRFAALMHAQPENNSTLDTRATILDICNRYRVPNAYKELAVLTAAHHLSALDAKNLSADELLNLFQAIDIYRRGERYQKFLLACAAIAKIKNRFFDTTWLKEAANIAKSIDIKALLAQKLEGAAFADKLKATRREKLTTWLLNKD